MGLVETNNTGLSGIVVKAALPDIQIFTADGTWTKPQGCKTVYMELYGGGGSGGGGHNAGSGDAGGGGGGGSMVRGVFPADSLPASLTVDVADSVAGGAVNNAGNPGLETHVSGGTFTFKAYGGGAGMRGGSVGNERGGGGGGGGAGGVGENAGDNNRG